MRTHIKGSPYYWPFVREIHRWPKNSLHKGPVARKKFHLLSSWWKVDNSLEYASYISPFPWWRHQMETSSALLALCAGNSTVPGEFPALRPVTRSFDIFFDPRPNKWWSKQWWRWRFETPSSPLWRHCDAHSTMFIMGYCGNTFPIGPLRLRKIRSYIIFFCELWLHINALTSKAVKVKDVVGHLQAQQWKMMCPLNVQHLKRYWDF